MDKSVEDNKEPEPIIGELPIALSFLFTTVRGAGGYIKRTQYYLDSAMVDETSLELEDANMLLEGIQDALTVILKKHRPEE